MKNTDPLQEWQDYANTELKEATALLSTLGFSLDQVQPHMSGERYLMQALTTEHGRKLILLGKRDSDSIRVIIKVTSDPSGMKELRHERTCRTVLHEMRFAYHVFFSPEELLFVRKGAFLISVHAFVPQEHPFLARPVKEQFSLALKAFKAQESAHATTYGHIRLVRKTFGERHADTYLSLFDAFREQTAKVHADNAPLLALLSKAREYLTERTETIEQYSGFLTHVDFVPHNFRVVGSDIYLLDHSSLVFGNKYEGWARFLNFMALYHPELEQALTTYVRDNRTGEESVSLLCMRIFRLGEIICYYTNALQKTSGDLHTLEQKRIEFWSALLFSLLEGKALPEEVRQAYISSRDSLRSKEEKDRQIGLH